MASSIPLPSPRLAHALNGALNGNAALGLGLPEEGRLSPFLPLGLPHFDARLGGLPRGRITEVLGPGSVGKTGNADEITF